MCCPEREIGLAGDCWSLRRLIPPVAWRRLRISSKERRSFSSFAVMDRARFLGVETCLCAAECDEDEDEPHVGSSCVFSSIVMLTGDVRSWSLTLFPNGTRLSVVGGVGGASVKSTLTQPSRSPSKFMSTNFGRLGTIFDNRGLSLWVWVGGAGLWLGICGELSLLCLTRCLLRAALVRESFRSWCR